MKVKILILLNLLLLGSACSTGIKLADSSENYAEKVVVLPLKNDDYNCTNSVENILRNKGYDVYSGKLLVDECVLALQKKVDDISIDEFIKFAKQRAIDKIIYGQLKYNWQEASYSQVGIMERDKIIEGNYAILNGYCINVKSKENKHIFVNYRLKKVSLGMPEFIYASPYF